MYKFLFISLLALLVSCKQRGLVVRLEGIGKGYLASYHVHTPDPRICCGFCGQQLVTTWSAPGCHKNDAPLSLVISYITGVHTFHKFSVPVFTRSGTYVYRFLGEDYRRVKGILAYKVEMFEGNHLLYCYKLPTFVDWIAAEGPPE